MRFKKYFVAGVVMCVLLGMQQAQAIDAIGKVIVASGTVTAGDAALKRGSSVYQGQAIKTGTDGRVQIRLIDATMIELPPNSVYRIDSFDKGSATKAGKDVSTLLKGGLRSITGDISKKDPYEVKTEVAVIGIRGTTFGLALQPTRNGAPQLLAGADSGVIAIDNKLLLGDGQTYRYASQIAGAPPQGSNIPPPGLNRSVSASAPGQSFTTNRHYNNTSGASTAVDANGVPSTAFGVNDNNFSVNPNVINSTADIPTLGTTTTGINDFGLAVQNQGEVPSFSVFFAGTVRKGGISNPSISSMQGTGYFSSPMSAQVTQVLPGVYEGMWGDPDVTALVPSQAITCNGACPLPQNYGFTTPWIVGVPTSPTNFPIKGTLVVFDNGGAATSPVVGFTNGIPAGSAANLANPSVLLSGPGQSAINLTFGYGGGTVTGGHLEIKDSTNNVWITPNLSGTFSGTFINFNSFDGGTITAHGSSIGTFNGDMVGNLMTQSMYIALSFMFSENSGGGNYFGGVTTLNSHH